MALRRASRCEVGAAVLRGHLTAEALERADEVALVIEAAHISKPLGIAGKRDCQPLGIVIYLLWERSEVRRFWCRI